MDWLWKTALNVLLGWVPTWAWIILAGLVIGWAWKTFGWQGVFGGVIAVLTLGAYRQGWRDRGEGKAPIVPPAPPPRPQPTQSRPAPRKIRTLWDIINGR